MRKAMVTNEGEEVHSQAHILHEVHLLQAEDHHREEEDATRTMTHAVPHHAINKVVQCHHEEEEVGRLQVVEDLHQDGIRGEVPRQVQEEDHRPQV